MDYKTTKDDNMTPIEAIDYLLQKFKFERYSYLIITILSFLVLAGCSIYLLVKKQQIEIVIGMFGTTGVISYACSRILKMWSDCTNIVTEYFKKG